ncbi:hypothetical protein TCAL_00225, partial [Tigriopus californicus]
SGYPRAPEEETEPGKSIILPQDPHEPSEVDDGLPVVVITPSSVMSVSPTIQLSSIVINPKWDRNLDSIATTSQGSNDEKPLFYNHNKNIIQSAEVTTATTTTSTSGKADELATELGSTVVPTPLSRVPLPDTLIELSTSSDGRTNESSEPWVDAFATRGPQRESQISASRTKESERRGHFEDESRGPLEALGTGPQHSDRSNQITSDRDPKSLLIPPSSFGSALSSAEDSLKSEKSIPSGNQAEDKDLIVLHPVILRLSRNQSYALTSSSASDPKQIFEFVSPNQKEKHVTFPTPRTPRSPPNTAPTQNNYSAIATPSSTSSTAISTTAAATKTTPGTTATIAKTKTSEATSPVSATPSTPSTTMMSSIPSELSLNHHNHGHHHHYTIPKSSIDLDVRSLLQEYNITDLELEDDEPNAYGNYQYAEGRSLSMGTDEANLDSEYSEFDRDESDELLRIYDRIRESDQDPKNPGDHREEVRTNIGIKTSSKQAIMSDGGGLSAQTAAVVEENVLGVHMVGHERPVESFNASVIIGIAVGAVVFVLIGLVGLGLFVYHERFVNKPQTLEDCGSDSGEYQPDSFGRVSQMECIGLDLPRDNFNEEMYSLDNDSFLNSLETMTIPSTWSESVRHDSDV